MTGNYMKLKFFARFLTIRGSSRTNFQMEKVVSGIFAADF